MNRNEMLSTHLEHKIREIVLAYKGVDTELTSILEPLINMVEAAIVEYGQEMQQSDKIVHLKRNAVD